MEQVQSSRENNKTKKAINPGSLKHPFNWQQIWASVSKWKGEGRKEGPVAKVKRGLPCHAMLAFLSERKIAINLERTWRKRDQIAFSRFCSTIYFNWKQIKSLPFILFLPSQHYERGMTTSRTIKRGNLVEVRVDVSKALEVKFIRIKDEEEIDFPMSTVNPRFS